MTGAKSGDSSRTMSTPPSGTVTFLFTDIEGSTRLLQALGRDRYGEVLREHQRLLREVWQRHAGYEVDTEGDAFFVAFAHATEAVAAAAEAQRALARAEWPEGDEVRVRIGIHSGEAAEQDRKYVGLAVHRAARIAAAAHGGQVLVSEATRALSTDEHVAATSLRALGLHRLKDFDEPVAIYQLGEESFPPLKTISNTNLPRPASSFVGREREIAEVVSLVRDGVRLVTLSGPGGSGKTRLAIEAATEVVGEMTAGVFWVGLATVREAALVTETIAQTLGARDDLAGHIGGRQLLLVLDNLEQVIDAAPGLVALLAACPNLQLLVTSRELLRVQAETDYPVPPLAAREAVELFCVRAQLDPGSTIAELCVRLDNLPLAVELAAARTRVLTPVQILDRLTQRLDLLKGGRDADPRQQTLRATIAWSHELLAADEQRLFARLAVFGGGCTLETAEQVIDTDIDTLQSLVDKSLVRHSGGRFWMLETIREYAVERLDESGEPVTIRRGHAEFSLRSRRRSSSLRGPATSPRCSNV
jgi:predicted ATPase/class 3 adenylate cyclase